MSFYPPQNNNDNDSRDPIVRKYLGNASLKPTAPPTPETPEVETTDIEIIPYDDLQASPNRHVGNVVGVWGMESFDVAKRSYKKKSIVVRMDVTMDFEGKLVTTIHPPDLPDEPKEDQ